MTARAEAPRLPEPTTEDVARRAYEIFEQRGFEHGRDMQHWLEAERELKGAS